MGEMVEFPVSGGSINGYEAVPELGRGVAMPPTLIIHDRDDMSTSVTDGAAIAAAWRGARLHVTTGLGHHRLLRDPDVVTEVVDFVVS